MAVENSSIRVNFLWHALLYHNPIIISRSNELAKTINLLTVSGEIGHNTNRIWFVSQKWKDFYDNEKPTVSLPDLLSERDMQFDINRITLSKSAADVSKEKPVKKLKVIITLKESIFLLAAIATIVYSIWQMVIWQNELPPAISVPAGNTGDKKAKKSTSNKQNDSIDDKNNHTLKVGK